MQRPLEQGSTGTVSVRARQACEPCRKKKRKCPGERPICSFCRRLNQDCKYGGPQDTLRLIQQDASLERLERLESHVERIYGLLE